jgi:hypothetical protein
MYNLFIWPLRTCPSSFNLTAEAPNAHTVVKTKIDSPLITIGSAVCISLGEVTFKASEWLGTYLITRDL